MEDFNVVNDTQGGNVDPQIDTNVQDIGASNDQQVSSDPATQKPVQDAQTNAYFAEQRRAREAAETRAAQLERDYAYAREYGHMGIYSEADYQKALVEQEAQQKGVDPQFYQEFNQMKNQLDSIQKEKTLLEQETNLRNDPIRSQFFKQWEGEVKQMANQFGTDYRSALAVIIEQRLGDLLNNTQFQAEQSAIQKIRTNAQSSPGALGGIGADHKTGYASLNADEKRKFRESVLRGENPTI
jgi:hypothetical protein